MSVGMLALKLTLMGLGTVFVILSILGLVMYCFKFVFGKENRADVKSVPESFPTPNEDRKQSEDLEESEAQEELVAVMAAAYHFARMRWKQPVVVKAVTPVWEENSHSSWLEAGRQEIINSKLGLRRAQ